MCVGCWAGVTYLRYTVLTSPNKDETAVHCCDPALSVLVMLVSRNVFHVVSALQSIVSNEYGHWMLHVCFRHECGLDSLETLQMDLDVTQDCHARLSRHMNRLLTYHYKSIN